MKQKFIFSFYLLLVFIVGSIFFTAGSGCANIIPPLGGPKDSLPPRLISAAPKDSLKNFSEKTIVLQFDEYIELENAYQQVIMSPLLKTAPVVSSKLKTVTVKIKDTLAPNTTYTINFGKSIKDINEGNPAKNFTYIFSTGDYFDSLKLKGRVILAETGKIDSTLTVMLHDTPDDSAVVNKKPKYVAKLDTLGRFAFANLPPGKFYLYAIKDESNTYRYFNTTQLFAFADSSVKPSTNPEPVLLFAYKTVEEKNATSAPPPTAKVKNKVERLQFVSSAQSGKQDILDTFTLRFATALKEFNPEQMQLKRDTTFTPLDGYKFVLDSTRQIVSLHNYAWIPGTQYHIILSKTFATDSSNAQLLKSDTLSFFTKSVGDYSKLNLTFQSYSSTDNPVLQVLQNNNLVKSYPLSNNRLQVPLFLPGEYELRILLDKNGNGLWDPGDFIGKHLQPERILQIERKLNLRAGMDIPIEIPFPKPASY